MIEVRYMYGDAFMEKKIYRIYVDVDDVDKAEDTAEKVLQNRHPDKNINIRYSKVIRNRTIRRLIRKEDNSRVNVLEEEFSGSWA